jgi:hypothetical protein
MFVAVLEVMLRYTYKTGIEMAMMETAGSERVQIVRSTRE